MGHLVRAERDLRLADEHLRSPFQRGGERLAALWSGQGPGPSAVPQHPRRSHGRASLGRGRRRGRRLRSRAVDHVGRDRRCLERQHDLAAVDAASCRIATVAATFGGRPGWETDGTTPERAARPRAHRFPRLGGTRCAISRERGGNFGRSRSRCSRRSSTNARRSIPELGIHSRTGHPGHGAHRR